MAFHFCFVGLGCNFLIVGLGSISLGALIDTRIFLLYVLGIAVGILIEVFGEGLTCAGGLGDGEGLGDGKGLGDGATSTIGRGIIFTGGAGCCCWRSASSANLRASSCLRFASSLRASSSAIFLSRSFSSAILSASGSFGGTTTTGGEGAGEVAGGSLKDGGRGTIGLLFCSTGLNNFATSFVFCLLERFLLFEITLTLSLTTGLTVTTGEDLDDTDELVLTAFPLAVVEVAPLAALLVAENPKLRYLLIYSPPYLRERK